MGQVRNVCHAKGAIQRTWVIEWDERKQCNSEWTVVFHWTCACQQQPLSKDHCNEIVYVIIIWLFVLKSFSKDFPPAVLLIPHSHGAPLTFVILHLIMFLSRRDLREGMYLWVGNLLITLRGFLRTGNQKDGKLACLLLWIPCRERSWIVLLIYRRLCLCQ